MFWYRFMSFKKPIYEMPSYQCWIEASARHIAVKMVDAWL